MAGSLWLSVSLMRASHSGPMLRRTTAHSSFCSKGFSRSFRRFEILRRVA